MQRLLLRVLLATLCVLWTLPASAYRSVAFITKQDAEKLGITVRATAAGPDAAWVTLEFKPEGKLKDYDHVEFEITEGGKPLIGNAVLSETRTPTGSISFTFMVNRAFLPKVNLSIIAGFARNSSSKKIALRDFINVAEIR